MAPLDGLLILVRWLHALAAVAWVGGAIFYWLVLRPALRGGNQAPPTVAQAVAREFRSLVDACIGVLLVSGTILAASRLTSALVGVPYFAVLALKVTLALWMFWTARALRARRTGLSGQGSARRGLRYVAAALTSAQATLVVGVIVILLSDILRFLVERGLSG
ncbi:MAG: hypothetical protein HYY00_03660 [Chloroflexi bacterium]|nr:hypothetical protein [Chloroflexota bacterium]